MDSIGFEFYPDLLWGGVSICSGILEDVGGTGFYLFAGLFSCMNRVLASFLKDRVPNDELALLPRGWRIMGDVIVVRDKRGVSSWGLVGETLLEIYPWCRYVLLDHGTRGVFREPEREVIASRGAIDSFETVHRENGCRFKLDTMRISFSQGNFYEKQRLTSLCQDEVVLDMFAGIGYFTVPIAVHSIVKRVVAIELSPIAHRYLEENIRLNRIEDRVEALLGDCGRIAPIDAVDRVIMGYLSSQQYLSAGISALRRGGVLHYHEAVPQPLYPARPTERIKEVVYELGRRIESITTRRVKKYSPGVLHSVTDARID